MSRMDRDLYYMLIAKTTALRGTCDRRQVGAVIVASDRILSAGFNGAPRGLPECDEVGHKMFEGHCVRTVHAEANALLEAGGAMIRRLARTTEVTIYTTTFPCPACMNLIINAGVNRVVYLDEYKDQTHRNDPNTYTVEIAELAGVSLVSASDLGIDV